MLEVVAGQPDQGVGPPLAVGHLGREPRGVGHGRDGDVQDLGVDQIYRALDSGVICPPSDRQLTGRGSAALAMGQARSFDCVGDLLDRLRGRSADQRLLHVVGQVPTTHQLSSLGLRDGAGSYCVCERRCVFELLGQLHVSAHRAPSIAGQARQPRGRVPGSVATMETATVHLGHGLQPDGVGPDAEPGQGRESFGQRLVIGAGQLDLEPAQRVQQVVRRRHGSEHIEQVFVSSSAAWRSLAAPTRPHVAVSAARLLRPRALPGAGRGRPPVRLTFRFP